MLVSSIHYFLMFSLHQFLIEIHDPNVDLMKVYSVSGFGALSGLGCEEGR